jgi:multidrug transporter EmrE-like cation transporter
VSTLRSIPVLWLYLLAATCYGLGGAAMKASGGLHWSRATALVYVLFGAGATIQTISLRRGELGAAYIAVLGLEALVALSLGLLFFDEIISVTKAIAVALIVAGVYLLHRPA